MIYKFNKIASISFLPLKLSELKDFLKITGNDEDKILTSLVKSAVNSFESYTGRVLLTRNLVMELGDFTSTVLLLPVHPVSRIHHIKLIDCYGKEISLNPQNYTLNANTSIVHFKNILNSHRIIIDFDAGMGNSHMDIPEDLKISLIKHVSFLYINRGQNREFNLSNYRQFKIIRI